MFGKRCKTKTKVTAVGEGGKYGVGGEVAASCAGLPAESFSVVTDFHSGCSAPP